MLDKREFQRIAAQGGRQLGATGGDAARAAFFLDMLAKWLWQEKSNIHLVDECATVFCEYLGERGAAGFTQAENPERFIPKLRAMGQQRVNAYIA